MPWDYGVCSRCSAAARVWSRDEDETDTWLCAACLDDDDRAADKEEQQRNHEAEYPVDKEDLND